MKSRLNELWIITDSEFKLIHQTFDESNLEFMKRYVKKAQEAGDDWKLLKFKLDSVIDLTD